MDNENAVGNGIWDYGIMYLIIKTGSESGLVFRIHSQKVESSTIKGSPSEVYVCFTLEVSCGVM